MLLYIKDNNSWYFFINGCLYASFTAPPTGRIIKLNLENDCPSVQAEISCFFGPRNMQTWAFNDNFYLRHAFLSKICPKMFSPFISASSETMKVKVCKIQTESKFFDTIYTWVGVSSLYDIAYLPTCVARRGVIIKLVKTSLFS